MKELQKVINILDELIKEGKISDVYVSMKQFLVEFPESETATFWATQFNTFSKSEIVEELKMSDRIYDVITSYIFPSDRVDYLGCVSVYVNDVSLWTELVEHLMLDIDLALDRD